jgi:hypothetical protein
MTMKRNKLKSKPKRRSPDRKKMAQEIAIMKDAAIQRLALSISHAADHQDLRGGLISIADSINRLADAVNEMRSTAAVMLNLADLLSLLSKKKS